MELNFDFDELDDNVIDLPKPAEKPKPEPAKAKPKPKKPKLNVVQTTKKPRRKFRNRSFCMIDADLIESEAFANLSGKFAIVCLLRFHQKIHRRITKRKGLKHGVITNNGEIIFTHAEAKELGMKSSETFYRVIRQLIELGFIDIVDRGNWYEKTPKKYAISERWRKYGTSEYERKDVPRILPKGIGFKKGRK